MTPVMRHLLDLLEQSAANACDGPGDARHLERNAAKAVHAADLELDQHHARPLRKQRVVSGRRAQIDRGSHTDSERRTTDARSTAVWRCDGGAMAADGRGLRRQGGAAGRWWAGQ